MRILRGRRFLTVCAAVMICLIAVGCSGEDTAEDTLQGTYHGGAMVLDFKGDKVIVNALGESKTLDYKVEGHTITLIDPAEGDVVLTRNADGTLNSAMGTFTKKTE
jgi:hypothetical protein